MAGGASSRAKTLSRFRKQRFLMSLSEDAFRDRVIRPVFLRQGLQDGRDLFVGNLFTLDFVRWTVVSRAVRSWAVAVTRFWDALEARFKEPFLVWTT